MRDTTFKNGRPFYFATGVFPGVLMVQTVICMSTWQAQGILLPIIKSEIDDQIWCSFAIHYCEIQLQRMETVL